MKESEARIIVYLNNVENPMKNLETISLKLNMDYSYCIRILKGLVVKNILFKHRLGRKSFYDLINKEIVVKAEEVLSSRVLEELKESVRQSKLNEEV